MSDPTGLETEKCDDCGTLFDPTDEPSCQHDGRMLCSDCRSRCKECVPTPTMRLTGTG